MSIQRLPTAGSADQCPDAGERTTWRREQAHLGAVCDFPGCDRHAERGLRMCDYHVMVRLASNGSWVDDSHLEGGHG